MSGSLLRSIGTAGSAGLGPPVRGRLVAAVLGGTLVELAVDASASTLSDAGTLLEAKALIAAGARMGTLPYMSPEQWRGETVDPRSDEGSRGRSGLSFS